MDVTLRLWREEDAADIVRWMEGGKVAENLRDGLPQNYALDDARAFIAGCLNESEDLQLMRAIDVGGRAVGSIGLFRKDNVYRLSAEVGYWLAQPYWGKGIMTSAVRLMCREGFARYDIVRIFAEPFARNTGSRRVLEKAGFTLEGVLRSSVIKQGEIMDSCIYGLLREEMKEEA